MAVLLPDLPYDIKALEPHMSSNTLQIHHGRHHAAYVAKLNAAIEGTPLEGCSLEEMLRQTANKPEFSGVFNNAAQAWNHSFFWNSLTPNGGGVPAEGQLLSAMNRDFGSYDSFVSKFTDAATSQFGSGWAWLVVDNDRLKIEKTSNADNPLVRGMVPLLTLDVWEHAYYLDFQNKRPDYIAVFLDQLVNWQFAESNLRLA